MKKEEIWLQKGNFLISRALICQNLSPSPLILFLDFSFVANGFYPLGKA
jgi:hypothetical protein